MSSNYMPTGTWALENGLEFGHGTLLPLDSFSDDGYSVNPGDHQSPRSDEIRFASDSLSPSILTFNIGVLNNRMLPNMALFANPGDGAGIIPARDIVEYFTFAWRNDWGRKQHGRAVPLSYNINGIDKIIYGRPRQLAVVPVGKDFCTIVATYQRMDSNSYGTEQFGTGLPLNPVGISNTKIIREPIAMANAWLRFLITGPITNPVITIGDGHSDKILVSMSGSIPAGVTVEINAKPWERRVVGSDGLNYAARLNGAYLDQMFIEPMQERAVAIRGSATSASTEGWAYWQEAYNTL